MSSSSSESVMVSSSSTSMASLCPMYKVLHEGHHTTTKSGYKPPGRRLESYCRFARHYPTSGGRPRTAPILSSACLLSRAASKLPCRCLSGGNRTRRRANDPPPFLGNFCPGARSSPPCSRRRRAPVNAVKAKWRPAKQACCSARRTT